MRFSLLTIATAVSAFGIDLSPQAVLSQESLLDFAHVPAVQETWRYMEEHFDAGSIRKAVRKYGSKNHLGQSQLKNKFREVFASPAFERVTKQGFTDHAMRIKKNHPEVLGLDTVEQYTGYLDVEKLDKHFFFWFYESRNDPANDPVILWLNGGPGCSSSTGLFFELGPSFINATLQPEYNPYAWNSNASVIFLDQPVGVGYSYTGAEQISTSRSGAKDVFVFLELFFQKFPHFLQNKFHIAGESYAGHYIPAIATEILSNADRSFELASILIGNGITDPLVQTGSYRPMGCGEGGYKAVLDEATCEKMKGDYKRCVIAEGLCYAFESAFTCVPANLICEELFKPYQETGLNPYDIRKPCYDSEDGLCYKEMGYVDDYLNLEFVKEAVGANVDIFTSCDDTVFFNFFKSGDGAMPFHKDVANLLDAGLPVLLYAGDKDYICNWLGSNQWSDALEYSGHDEFSSRVLKQYKTKSGKVAGEAKNYENFTFVRVYDAGHMVPYDQPEVALDMVNRWIGGDYGFE